MRSVTEGEEARRSRSLPSSPSVAFGATSPWRGRIGEWRSGIRPARAAGMERKGFKGVDRRTLLIGGGAGIGLVVA